MRPTPPAADGEIRNWRVGHYFRKPPTDYGDFLIGKTDRLPDASLNGLAQDLRLAMRAPLFTRERLAALWRLNTGHHSGIDLSRYQDPRIHVPVSSADAITMLLQSFRPLDPGARQHVDKIRFDRKLRLEVLPPRPARELRLRLSRNSPYEIRVNGKPQATLPSGRGWALQRHTIRFAEPRVVETIEIRALTTADDSHFIRGPRLL